MNDNVKAKVSKQSQSDKAYEILKWKILNSELALGQLYTEMELCEVSGLGRSPVRNALFRLNHDRLIKVVPRKGMFIRGWSTDELKSVMESRLILESATAGMAAKNATSEQIKYLDQLMNDADKFLEKKDRKSLMRVDHDFHIGLADASGNPVLAELIGSLKQRSNPLWFLRITGRDKLEVVQTEHRAILEAVKKADPEAAVKALRDHIKQLSEVIG